MKESYIIPLVLFGVYFRYSGKLLALYVDRIVFYRALKTIVAFNLSTATYIAMNSYAWPNKRFHEIVTQPEPNGKYVRTILKENYPRHWSTMSAKMHDLGYNFKEMNEYSENMYMPDVTYKFDGSRY